MTPQGWFIGAAVGTLGLALAAATRRASAGRVPHDSPRSPHDGRRAGEELRPTALVGPQSAAGMFRSFPQRFIGSAAQSEWDRADRRIRTERHAGSSTSPTTPDARLLDQWRQLVQRGYTLQSISIPSALRTLAVTDGFYGPPTPWRENSAEGRSQGWVRGPILEAPARSDEAYHNKVAWAQRIIRATHQCMGRPGGEVGEGLPVDVAVELMLQSEAMQAAMAACHLRSVPEVIPALRDVAGGAVVEAADRALAELLGGNWFR